MDLKTLLNKKEFVLLDGAMGTMIQKSGAVYDHSPETLNITRPELIQSFHKAYIDAGADIVYAWEGAKIGMMDAAAAAKIMYDGCEASVITEKTAEYDALQNSAASAAAHGYVDAVIDPAETRKYLIGALDMLFTKREYRPDKKHGTV